MSDRETISVNFGKPVPVFPLDGVVLLPQQVLPLHIFEPRYVQMVDRVLDGSGQIALGVFSDESWKTGYDGQPPIKPHVCLGQIAQHETLPGGRYNILLQGVCRAKVLEEFPPDEERLYRTAKLDPVGVDPQAQDGDDLEPMRGWIEQELTDGPLKQLTVSENVLEFVRNDTIPMPALLELIGFTIVTDPTDRYRLLAEGDVRRRAAILRSSLGRLDRMVRLADKQRPDEWPKGMSWN